MKQPLILTIAALTLILGGGAACDREKPITSYDAPKNPPAPAEATPSTTAMPSPEPAASVAGGAGGATWSLPQGWTAEPGDGFRLAAIHPPGHVLIKVSKLNNGGSPGANVTRWHGEVGLPPVDDAQADAGVEKPLGGQKWIIHDYTGPKDGGTREIIAQQDAGGSTWYFKLLGPTADVAGVEGDFEKFIGSVRLPR